MTVDDVTAAPAGDSAQPVDHSLEGVLAQWRKDQEQEAAKPEGDKPEGDEAPLLRNRVKSPSPRREKPTRRVSPPSLKATTRSLTSSPATP
jgi:hypothetical protein